LTTVFGVFIHVIVNYNGYNIYITYRSFNVIKLSSNHCGTQSKAQPTFKFCHGLSDVVK